MVTFRDLIIMILAVGIHADAPFAIRHRPRDPHKVFLSNGDNLLNQPKYKRTSLENGDVIQIRFPGKCHHAVCLKFDYEPDKSLWDYVKCEGFKQLYSDEDKKITDDEFNENLRTLKWVDFEENEANPKLVIKDVIDQEIERQQAAIKGLKPDAFIEFDSLMTSIDTEGMFDEAQKTAALEAHPDDARSAVVYAMKHLKERTESATADAEMKEKPSYQTAVEIDAKIAEWEFVLMRWTHQKILETDRFFKFWIVSCWATKESKAAKVKLKEYDPQLTDLDRDIAILLRRYEVNCRGEAVDLKIVCGKLNEWRGKMMGFVEAGALTYIPKKDRKKRIETIKQDFAVPLKNGCPASDTAAIEYSNDYAVYQPQRYRGLVQNRYEYRGREEDVNSFGAFTEGLVVGGSAMIIIMIVFCTGLAFGFLVLYWFYQHRHANEEEEDCNL